jgi:hypothetical protein
VAVIVSLEADALGIGRGIGIGWKQALGAVVGVMIVAVGAWYWPGFPQSRLLADGAAQVPAASRSPQKSVSAEGRRKPPAAKKARAAKGSRSSRSSKRRRK